MASLYVLFIVAAAAFAAAFVLTPLCRNLAILLLFSLQGGDIVRGHLGQVVAAVAAFAAGVGFFATRPYSHTTNGHHVANIWSIRIALSETDFVELSREFDTQPPAIVAPFADTIGKALRAKSFEQREVAWPPARRLTTAVQSVFTREQSARFSRL